MIAETSLAEFVKLKTYFAAVYSGKKKKIFG